MSLLLKAETYFFCFSDLGITDFFGVLIMYSIFLSKLLFSLIINLLTDEIISFFSIDPLIIY